jgi:hypothetical protein
MSFSGIDRFISGGRANHQHDALRNVPGLNEGHADIRALHARPESIQRLALSAVLTVSGADNEVTENVIQELQGAPGTTLDPVLFGRDNENVQQVGQIALADERRRTNNPVRLRDHPYNQLISAAMRLVRNYEREERDYFVESDIGNNFMTQVSSVIVDPRIRKNIRTEIERICAPNTNPGEFIARLNASLAGTTPASLGVLLNSNPALVTAM